LVHLLAHLDSSLHKRDAAQAQRSAAWR
jgi:hypothetical protein